MSNIDYKYQLRNYLHKHKIKHQILFYTKNNQTIMKYDNIEFKSNKSNKKDAEQEVAKLVLNYITKVSSFDSFSDEELKEIAKNLGIDYNLPKNELIKKIDMEL